METWLERLLVVSVLLLALGGMMVHYGAVHEAHFPYTPTTDLRDDYTAHLGEMTYFWAEVTAVGEDRFEVENFALQMTVHGPTDGLQPGDTVQVYGSVQPGRTIAAERVVVSNQLNRLSMFVLSALAPVVLALVWWRHWWFDWRTLTVRRRGERP